MTSHLPAEEEVIFYGFSVRHDVLASLSDIDYL